ncbi:MAG: PEP/pyruvate-binding domain-containing protein, partial [Bacteroidaceae bacterium]
EYTALSLRYPPRFTQVSNVKDALKMMESVNFDLLICMPGNGDNDSFVIGRLVKDKYPTIPIVILTPFSHGITHRIKNEDLSAFDYVFCWLGNTELILSIIKLIEDKMNLEADIQQVGVQLLLVVEDGIRFYSSILPIMYKFILQQSQAFSTEALNPHQRTLRMRGRPKIVLARTYDEAMEIYQRHKENVLGIISDVRFPIHSQSGVKDSLAGVKLISNIRKNDPFLPIIIESSESKNRIYAKSLDTLYVDKNSEKLDVDLQEIVSKTFGFGDFVFKNPTTNEEIARVHNLRELQTILYALPEETFRYHVQRNHISRWLYSRAMFPLARFLKQITFDNDENLDKYRDIIADAIVRYRRMKNQGVVATFKRDQFDRYSNFARIGEGSLGGKGRGLAFIDNMLKRYHLSYQFEHAKVVIPKTVVLCTDIFDDFMETNKLYQVALSDVSDEEILKHFLRAKLSDELLDDFFTFLEVVDSPIAIRSSSLLEDAHYQPFAGIYNTYMIPYFEDKYEMIRLLSDAIKGVYASVFFKNSKDYMQATKNVIDQEKMGVVLQEVAGTQHGDRYYPSISGVAQSLNYYPLGDEKAEEGVVNLALGLGKYIVDGGKTLRFSPNHPQKVLQTSEVDLALRETQTKFYALDLSETYHKFSVDDGFNLETLTIKDAEKDGSLRFIASTFDAYNGIIRDGLYPGGRKLITFANILQHNVFPLAEIMKELLAISDEAIQRPVEIEFAVTLDSEQAGKGIVYLLQVRPIVDISNTIDEDLTMIPKEELLLQSNHSLGHGVYKGIRDVVYVRTEHFNPANNQLLVDEIAEINKQILSEKRSYILIGPGRWGSSDPWLGIPVKWSHISGAQLIVEAGLNKYRIDPSQGTHFFQNLTSFGVGYFTINPYSNDGMIDYETLDVLPALYESDEIRHVRLNEPMTLMMDGMKKTGVVRKEK